MEATKTITWLKRAATLALLPVMTVTVTGCVQQGTDEPAVALEDLDERDLGGQESDDTLDSGPYDEVYDQSFWDELTIYFGEEVTLSAQVRDPIGAQSFTLAGMDDTTVDPLLVIHRGEVDQVDPGEALLVNGTVHEYLDINAVEDEIGMELDDALFEQWDNEPYLLAESVKPDATAAP